VIHPDGREEARDVGTPQGGVISPLLANLFLHYAFDKSELPPFRLFKGTRLAKIWEIF